MPPSGLSQSELESAREYALQLVNDARTANGLNPVTLNDNEAAQSHADDMRANCVTGHWGTDGLKPYMRYTLAGGEQYSSENVSGSDYCPPDPYRYVNMTFRESLDVAMRGLMNSPGHRRNILDPKHLQVNIGISSKHPNFWLVQLFVGDYVEYVEPPDFDDGELTLSGSVKNGANIDNNQLSVTISWEQPPHPLTRGQLHHSGCVSGGKPVAALNPNNSFAAYEIYGTSCGDPYEVAVDAPSAESYDDAKSRMQTPFSIEVELIPTIAWKNEDNYFEVKADVNELLYKYGYGVYTINLWAIVNGEQSLISEYPVFVPPLDQTQAHVLARVSPTPMLSPSALSISIPSPEPIIIPIAVPSSTPTVTPIPIDTVTVASTPEPTTPSGLNDSELDFAREYALGMINEARTSAGLRELTLDDNPAAQSHAEDMKANCFLSHWDTEGLKPYMRNSLAGGYRYASVYVSGFDYCPSDPQPYRHQSLEDALSELIHRYLNNPEYRDDILDPNIHMLGFGLSHQRPNWWIVLKFVSDFVRYNELPTIHGQMLRLSGEVFNGVHIEEDSLAVSIDHDPTPHALTRGQLQYTDCLRHGDRIGALRRPLEDNAYYSSNSFTPAQPRCVDPYFVSVDAPVATSYTFIQPPLLSQQRILISATWITASEWSVTNDSFQVSADISNLLAQHGNGVYTIVIWGEINGERTPISEYSIFIPPYSPAP